MQEFERDLEANLEKLSREQAEQSYCPQPVRRVEIPKPDEGVRKLGVPFGQGRIVPIWAATLTLRHGRRVVRFDNPAHLLDYFRLRGDGSQYHGLVVCGACSLTVLRVLNFEETLQR